jgi:hypothetical protein
MANFERTVAVSVDGREVCRIDIRGFENEGLVDVIARRMPGGPEAKVAWIIDWEARTITSNVAQAVASSAQISCLAACLVGASGAFANCLLKARSKADVWKCVEENAVGAVFSSLGCVLACF